MPVMTQAPLKILVVDDSDDDILLLHEAFRDEPRVEMLPAVRNGDAALAFLRGVADSKHSNRPGLVLLDVNMPGKTGFEVLTALKGDPALKEIPVVMLSTSSLESDISRAYACGANSFVTKPGSFDVLRVLTRDLVDNWSTTDRQPPSEM